MQRKRDIGTIVEPGVDQRTRRCPQSDGVVQVETHLGLTQFGMPEDLQESLAAHRVVRERRLDHADIPEIASQLGIIGEADEGA